MNTVPYYWRLSGFYFFYFGSLGALMPYWGLYLEHLGFHAEAIGELIAIILATRIIAPNFWGWIADYMGQHMILVRFNSLLAILCFIGVLFGQSYGWLALIMGLFSFFWNAALPQFEANTLAHLASQACRYCQIRVWGSIGFIVTVVLFGWLFEHISITLLPTLLIGLFASIWLSSLLVPEKTTISHHSVTSESFYQVLRRPSIIALFVVCLLMQASHGPYYTFYSIYLEHHHYSRDMIGQLWALGVIAEVGIFLVMHRLFARFKLRHLLITCFVLTGMRWLLIGYYVQSLPLLLFAQLLHAVSFGMYHGVVMQFIHQYFTGHHQGRAQALYSSLSFGIGGAIGSLVSGYTWENAGAQVSYLWAVGCCCLALWISWQWVGRDKGW